MSRPWTSGLGVLALLLGCGTKYTLPDLDGDGLTAADGDCWDAPEGPTPGGPGGADIHPEAEETWYDGVDQDCAGDDDFDQDGDGFDGSDEGGAEDCDDENAGVHPGATEIPYDGLDQDCDLEDLVDQDGDGYSALEAGGEDCDDLDADVWPGATEIWYDDIDEDCAGDDDFDQDKDGSPVDEDCDDTDPTRYPGVDIDEVWYNGFDEDCDGNDGDQDGDGYVPDGYAALHDWTEFPAHVGVGDCWDDPEDPPTGVDPINGFPDLDAPDLNPGAIETFYDGIDQDCAGGDDFDQDNDGFQASGYRNSLGDYGEDCIDGSDRDSDNPGGVAPEDAYPGADETWYDGTDQDCAEDDDYDRDDDGFTSSDYGVGSADDCDDGDPLVYPGASERCDTSYDDNCDGSTNDPDASGCSEWLLDADGDDYGTTDSLCLCEPSGDYSALLPGDCDDADSATSPAGTEICDDDDADEDCDGLVDDDDPTATGESTGWLDGDGDGYGDPSDEVSACDLPPTAVANDDDCDDNDEQISPSADEVCDPSDTDEDCDGAADDSDSSPSGTSDWYADLDGDGFGDPGETTATCERPSGYLTDNNDCDDTRDEINPAAVEVCDAANTDEDCDGLADDADSGATGKSVVYADDDGDSYGDLSRPSSACDLGSGEASSAGDCDDTNHAINPGAAEVCDASDVDEDCDAVADDGDPSVTGTSTWYRDGDGDGYGSASATLSACNRPGGYTSSGSDCDDAAAATYPGAAEVCEDGVVNDCGGTEADALSDCGLIGTASLSSGDRSMRGEHLGDRAGIAVSGAGDVNGDGLDDLLVGADLEGTGGSAAGAVYLMWGDALRDGSAVGLASAGVKWIGEGSGSYAGHAVAGAGDVDGDGRDDLLLGAPEIGSSGSEAGAAYLVLATSLSGTSSPASLGSASLKITGARGGDHAGYAAAGAGDVDGDGLADVLIGRYTSASDPDPGAAYLLFGGGSLYGAGSPLGLSSADVVLSGATPNDNAGYAVSSAGDVDDDGLDDVLVSALQEDSGGDGAGAGYLLLGATLDSTSSPLSLAAADLKLTGESASDAAGASVSAGGDINGDGVADLLIGAHGYDATTGDAAGAAYVVLCGEALPASGSTIPLADADLRLVGEDAADFAGYALDGAGDVDADGLQDVVVGAYREDSGGTSAGAAYLLLGGSALRAGSTTLNLASADLKLVGEGDSDNAGIAVSGAGDIDADGADDLVVGASGAGTSGSEEGTAYLIFGGGY